MPFRGTGQLETQRTDYATVVRANLPRSVFWNRELAPFTVISRSTALYTAVTMLPNVA